MRAPPASNRPMIGARAFMARSWIFTIFCAWVSDSEPPNTVKSLANTKTVRPLTVPQPMTTPSPGIFRCLSMPKSTDRCSTNMSNSSNEPLSIRSSMRSRAVSLPRLCCASMRGSPPPSRACPRRLSSFSRMSFMRIALREVGPADRSVLLKAFSQGGEFPPVWRGLRRMRPLVRPLEPPRHAHDEDQHLGDRLVELDRNLVADLDLRERAGERGILLDGHAVFARGVDDLLSDLALALGDDARRAGLLVVQRDRERVLVRAIHEARSRKRPDA